MKLLVKEIFNLLLEIWNTRHSIEVGDEIPSGVTFTGYHERKAEIRTEALRFSLDSENLKD